MQFTKQQLVFLIAGGIVALLILLVLFGILPGRRESSDEIELIVWGVDEPRVWRDIIGRFEGTHPGINVRYQAFSEGSYEEDFVNALARGENPDVLMFENNWLLKHGDKVVPAPTEKITLTSFQTLFPRVAEQDLTGGGNVYALPLSIDTLVLAYNRALFDQSGVVFPPKTWDEVAAAVPQLSVKEEGILERAAFAIGGTSLTIPNAYHLIEAMFLQGGVPMVNEKLTSATFANEEGRTLFGAYARFSDPASTAYTWNDSMRPAYEAFARNEVAGIFVYASELQNIEARNAFIDIGLSELPQLDLNNAVNIADYWGLAVASRSNYPSEAWDLVVFATTNPSTATSYASATGYPPALRSLIQENINTGDTTGALFARQALTAQSYLHLGDNLIRDAFDEAIGLVLSREQTPNRAIQRAEAIITEALKQR